MGEGQVPFHKYDDVWRRRWALLKTRRVRREERRKAVAEAGGVRRRGSGGWMEGVSVLRQLVGQIQELWELYSLDQPRSDPRCYILDLRNKSMEDYLCGRITRGKSEFLEIVEPNATPPSKRSRRERRCENLLASVSTDTMEPQIWKDFPEDLFEAVIARLPITTFFRFRTVCQKWNSLLTSSNFSQSVAEVPQVCPWVYTVTNENISVGVMYDPSTRKWHHKINPFQHQKTIILPVASAGGLICFLNLGHTNFYVSNPLTDSFKELPPRSVKVWSRVAVGMILNGKTANSGYKIMWIGCDGDYEIYDSVHNNWIHCGNFPANIKLPLFLNFRSQTISIGSTLYFMLAEPDGILSYDMANSTWKQFIIPSPLHLADHTLAEYRGKVMLVGLLSKNAATCICVWELQQMTLLWKEVDRMPNVWCLDFYGKHIRMTCLSNRGFLMLSLRSRRMNCVVTYDMENKEWQRVPDGMLPHGLKRQWITCGGIAFHPCLTALAC